jgi:FKBP-type peptidyl-prolyl cis-trans isomerase (trigger factor)
MENGIKKTSEIEGEIVITLEENDYLKDFKDNIAAFKKRFTRNGFRGKTTPDKVIYDQYGYNLLYHTCMQKVHAMLKGIIKEDPSFTNSAYSDVIPISSSFPGAQDNIKYTKPGSFSFTFQYGLIKKINIDDSSLGCLEKIKIEKERCLDLSEEELEFFTKKIYFNLINKTTNDEGLNKINLEDLDIKNVNTSSLFFKTTEDVKSANLEWLLDDLDVNTIINSDINLNKEIDIDNFKKAVKANVLFILNAIIGKKFRVLLRERCLEAVKIEVPLNYLRAKIKSILKNSNDKIVEHYLPLFSNAIKWECLRTAIKDKNGITYSDEECRAYDDIYKYLKNSALYCEYDDMLSKTVTPGTYDNFSESSLAVIDLKVVNMLESRCEFKVIDVTSDDILNKLFK